MSIETLSSPPGVPAADCGTGGGTDCGTILVKNIVVDGDDGRPSEVDTRPLAKWSSRHSIHTLAPVRADRLVLRGNNLVRAVSITFFVIAALILLGFGETNTLDENKARRAREGVGSLFLILAVGIWLAPPRVVFDRRRGQVSRRHWFSRTRYPLKDIVAVQIICGGWHSWGRNSTSHLTRELNLVLDSTYAPRVNLTNHTDHATTRLMAAEIARFLEAPVWDAFAHELRDPATVQQHARTPASRLETVVRYVARLCYLAAFAAGFFCVIFSLQQAGLDELEATVRPVRARLISTEVKQWIEGHDNWYASGTFEIESGEFQGRATGSLIPHSFYEDRLPGRSRSSYPSIPRGEAAKFLALWEIGRTYDGYVHSDASDRIFFELPGAETNARLVWRLGITSAVFLTLGVVASGCIAYLTRRQPSAPTNKPAESANSSTRARRRRG